MWRVLGVGIKIKAWESSPAGPRGAQGCWGQCFPSLPSPSCPTGEILHWHPQDALDFSEHFLGIPEASLSVSEWALGG